jgi:alpha-mannosidase
MKRYSIVGFLTLFTAWLWPYAETRRKSARSFSTQVFRESNFINLLLILYQIRYMDEYPEYKFTQSQAQLYEWVKVDYPELYEQMKDKIKKGQFVPTGGVCSSLLPSPTTHPPPTQ